MGGGPNNLQSKEDKGLIGQLLAAVAAGRRRVPLAVGLVVVLGGEDEGREPQVAEDEVGRAVVLLVAGPEGQDEAGEPESEDEGGLGVAGLAGRRGCGRRGRRTITISKMRCWSWVKSSRKWPVMPTTTAELSQVMRLQPATMALCGPSKCMETILAVFALGGCR